MLVTIVAVPLPDNSGLDVSRLEKVEDLEPEIAQNMLDVGTAREPSAEELAEYRKAAEAKRDTEARTPEQSAVKADTPAETGAKFGAPASLPAGETTVTNNTDEPEPVTAPAASE